MGLNHDSQAVVRRGSLDDQRPGIHVGDEQAASPRGAHCAGPARNSFTIDLPT